MKQEDVAHCAVIGGGSFGTALALVIARKGGAVSVWVRSEEQANSANTSGFNEKYLPGVPIPKNITFTTSVVDAVKGAEIVLIAIPTQFLRHFLTSNRSTLPVGSPLVLCAKGVELESLQTPYEILRDELPGKYGKYIAVLSGPSFAKEMAKGLATNVAVAADDPELAKKVQRQISSREAGFRCYSTPDLMGCEVAGAAKNVLAIASGASSGLGLGLNARAGLVCRGLAEIRVLALALGSTGEALHGLAGVGDLMLTCSSELSRNFTVGLRLARGESIADITGTLNAVAEGVATARALHALCAKLGVHMPICHEVYMVLYENKPLAEALKTLMERPLGPEQSEALIKGQRP